MAVPVDFNRILATLNRAGLQIKDPVLYQAIKSLIEGGAQAQSYATGQVATLTTAIQNQFTYGLAADKANYKPQKIVGSLVFYFETDTGNLFLFDFSTDDWVPVGAPTDATYLTATDESARLPNSRQLIEGSGIELDISVANKMKVNLDIHPFLLMGA